MNGKTKARFVTAILGCLAMLGAAVGTTYALFTSEKTITNHLTIGSGLKAGLYLTSLVQDKVDPTTGRIVEETSDLTKFVAKDGSSCYDSAKAAVDLAKYDGEIFTSSYIVPTMEGKATLRLYNLGDLAFDYKVDVVKTAYDASGNKDDDAKALDQIVFAFDYTLQTVEKGSYADIEVSYEFKDADDNNDAVSQSITLDLKVSATQVVKA